MNELNIERIRKYCAEATDGPWGIVVHGNAAVNGASIENQDGYKVASLSRKADKPIQQKEADGRLITSARTDIPLLVAAIDGLQLENTALTAQRQILDSLSRRNTELQSDLSAAQKRIDWALVQVRAMLDEFADAAHMDLSQSVHIKPSAWPQRSMAYKLALAYERLSTPPQ